jgi:hypothetical protein
LRELPQIYSDFAFREKDVDDNKLALIEEDAMQDDGWY